MMEAYSNTVVSSLEMQNDQHLDLSKFCVEFKILVKMKKLVELFKKILLNLSKWILMKKKNNTLKVNDI